jgi:hypothetical protein
MIPANAGEAALQRLEGAVNSFVREAGATMAHVDAQYRTAVQLEVGMEALSAHILRGATAPPKAKPQRVSEIKARFALA